jgi:dimethylargininase
MIGPLERVFVRAPSTRRWRAYGWRNAPDPDRLATEHEAFCSLLQRAGSEVVVGSAMDGDPDAVYTFDPCVVSEHGAIVLRPGKQGRQREPDSVVADLGVLDVPIAGRVEAPAVVEGGDLVRLDERTLLAGRGYRTNADGIATAAGLLPGVETHVFDLPHWRGEGNVMHLLSLLSPLDVDLVVAYTPLLPVRLVELLQERSISIVPVPDEEFSTMGANVLALAPRVGLALDVNRATRRRLERAGVDVLVYAGDELSLKGDGGPTCLTMPVLRGA